MSPSPNGWNHHLQIIHLEAKRHLAALRKVYRLRRVGRAYYIVRKRRIKSQKVRKKLCIKFRWRAVNEFQYFTDSLYYKEWFFLETGVPGAQEVVPKNYLSIFSRPWKTAAPSAYDRRDAWALDQNAELDPWGELFILPIFADLF